MSLGALERKMYLALKNKNWDEALAHLPQLSANELWRRDNQQIAAFLDSFLRIQTKRRVVSDELLKQFENSEADPLPWEVSGILAYKTFLEAEYSDYTSSHSMLFARKSCKNHMSSLCLILLFDGLKLDHEDIGPKLWEAPELFKELQIKENTERPSRWVYDEIWISQKALEEREDAENQQTISEGQGALSSSDR